MKRVYITIGIFLSVGIFLAILFRQPDLKIDYLTQKYTDTDSRFLEIDKTKVHYKIEGSGPNLVLIHGTASSLHTWDEWTENLKQDFRVVRLDLPAFGITGPHPDRQYTIDFYTNFLNSFLEELKIDSCSIAGNSLGGLIAWKYAVDYPQKVDKLILIDAAGVPKDKVPTVFKIARNPLSSFLLKIYTPRSFIEKNIKEVYHQDELVTSGLIERYFELSLRPGNRQAFIDRARLTQSFDTSQLRQIECPTLIQWGSYDEWIPLEDGFHFNQLIPNSSLVMYEAGHVPMEEMPEATAMDAKDFLLQYDQE